jgi:hypothetical protein
MKPTPSVKGVFSVEYCGKPCGENDGVCLTLLLQIHSPHPEQPLQPLSIKNPDRYEWQTVDKEELQQQLRERMTDGQSVPLLMLR